MHQQAPESVLQGKSFKYSPKPRSDPHTATISIFVTGASSATTRLRQLGRAPTDAQQHAQLFANASSSRVFLLSAQFLL